MPQIQINPVKISLSPRLLLFLVLLGFTICFHLFCFATSNLKTISIYSLQKSPSAQKQSIFYCNPIISGSETAHISNRHLQFFSTPQNHSKRTLQNHEYSNKLSNYTLKALKSSLDVLKSSQKFLIALKKQSTSLRFSIFEGLFMLFLDQNITL